MSATGYRLLGIAVWNGGKWYLRRRVAVRRLALKGALGAGALAGAAVLVRRLAG
ncbi:MAG: hypothetical protein JWM60_622 [Solirubrobacterales bacterium]|jgi:hypothetical protein|nr:hypothetical protein [Solirubrobacterales bacterium]